MIKVDEVAKALAGASQVTILDMREAVNYTDYFVICHVADNKKTSEMMSQAVNTLTELGYKAPKVREKDTGKHWLIADYGTIVLHVFTREAREFYRLERLWGMVPRHEVA